MCITNPLKISDFQGNLLHMLLFSQKHAFYFSILRIKEGLSHVQQPLFFDLTQPVWVATNKISRYVVPSHNFNLTQPVWVATASLHKRNNKLSCILYNVCLFFDQTIWSDTTYCNGIISFLYNTRCEATSKTMFTYHPHL